jgi:hypothetical protein
MAAGNAIYNVTSQKAWEIIPFSLLSACFLFFLLYSSRLLAAMNEM